MNGGGWVQKNTLVLAALLASGAAMVAATHAPAAELPTLRSAPSKHARTCNVGGMVGYQVAGSSVCVKISGYVSVGAEAGNTKSSPSK
jgi:hypothetical protein